MSDAGDNRNEQCAANYSETAANDAPRGEAPQTTDTPQNTASAETPPSTSSDLISQARELLKDPAFMDEVMQLVKLRLALQKEIKGLASNDMLLALSWMASRGET